MATTPGPWRVDPDDATSVLASDDRVTIVACVTGASSNPVAVADAHLIAAAPDLLAACYDALGTLMHEPQIADRALWPLPQTLKRLREAIAKAEGR